MKFLSAVVFLLFGAAQSANALTIYDCNLKNAKKRGWIQPRVVIAHDEAKDAVVVSDPLILHYNDKQPLRGRVAESNDRRITFAWDLGETRSASGQTTQRFQYRATYIKGNKQFFVTAKPLGYPNGFREDGRCKITKK